MTTGMTRLLAVCALLVACDVGAVDGDDGDPVLESLAKPDYMRRVVITRLYQKLDFTPCRRRGKRTMPNGFKRIRTARIGFATCFPTNTQRETRSTIRS